MGIEIEFKNQDGGTECQCGAAFDVIVATCGIVNCPMCGSAVKVGSCAD